MKAWGFSLIELLLVISIVMVMGGSSAVFYSRLINQNSVANVSDEITEQLHKAQIYAMVGKNNSSWGVKIVGNTLTLFSSAGASWDEDIGLPSNIGISGWSTVTFSKGTGLADVSPTVVISEGSNSRTLILNSQGVINR